MDYVPTDWVDNVTPVDAANLDKMEAGIDTAHQEIDALDGRLDTIEAKPSLPAVVDGQWVKGAGGVPVWSAIAQADVTGLVSALAAKEALVNKGAVNGYAPLGADQKVPLTNLPEISSGGADLTYEGDFVAATEYQDGDVVVKDGVAYICVGGPTTVAPDPAPWGAAALAKVAYGTTLPVAPVDGQEAILVDSLTNPTYQWRFRYNAGSASAYKWEFIGGAPKGAGPQGDMTLAGGSGDTPLTGGPTFVLPRNGDYRVQWGLSARKTSATAGALITDVWDGVGGGVGRTVLGTTALDNFFASATFIDLKTTMVAARTLAIRAAAPTASAGGQFTQGWLLVTPVRVS